MRTCYIPSPFANLLLKMAIGADRTGKPPLRCSLLLLSSLAPLPGQWDRRQCCKYTLGATFVSIAQNILIARHKSLGRATIARHNIKHALCRAIAARVAFYSQPGLKPINEPCFFHSCLSICPKSKSDINILVKYWRLILKSHWSRAIFGYN